MMSYYAKFAMIILPRLLYSVNADIHFEKNALIDSRLNINDALYVEIEWQKYAISQLRPN